MASDKHATYGVCVCVGGVDCCDGGNAGEYLERTGTSVHMNHNPLCTGALQTLACCLLLITLVYHWSDPGSTPGLRAVCWLSI
jgi:hypothetical protein